jgi:hypothetical protein
MRSDSVLTKRTALVLTDIVMATACVAMGSLAFVASNVHSPLSLPFSKRVWVTTISPEGWAFFTRDPQETRLLIHRLDSESRELRDANPATLRSALDVIAGSRASRIQGMEAARIQQLLPAERTYFPVLVIRVDAG